MMDIDAVQPQTSTSKVLEKWVVPVLAGTPTAVVATVARAHGQGQPVLEVLAAKEKKAQ